MPGPSKTEGRARIAPRVRSLLLALVALAASAPASAQLLGVSPGLPLLNYNNTGTTSYTAGSGEFVVIAQPLAVLFPGPVPRPVFGPKSVSIDIRVDGTGTLLGGVPGDDLIVVGAVDTTGDGVLDANGTLLTGEVVAFGSSDSGGPTDAFDFVFTVTGGALAPFYAGQQIGVTLTSEGSSFTGDFTVDFGGAAKGNIGPVPPEPDIALCKLVSLTGGDPFHDADADPKNRCDDFLQTVPVGTVGSTDATYRLLVINTGSEPLRNLVINDTQLAIGNVPVDLSGTSVPGTLQPGEEIVVDAASPGFQNLFRPGRCPAPGIKPNTAVVDAEGAISGQPTNDADDAAVDCVAEDIQIVKEVSVDGGTTFFDANTSGTAPVTTVGGDALYRLTVTNIGTSDLVNVVVNDPTLGIVNFPVGNLAVNQVVVLTQGEIPVLDQPGRCQGPGEVDNVASVAGQSADTGNTVTDDDPAIVRCVREDIVLLKEVSVDGGVTFFDANTSGTAPVTGVGGDALYRLTVTNTGTSDLVNVVINDTTLGIVAFPVGDLAVGQTVVLTEGEIPALEQRGRCQDPGDVTNIANVLGQSADTGNDVASSDPAVVRCVEEAIDLRKEVSVDGGVTFEDANDGATAPVTGLGGVVIYRLVVTNTGTSDLVNVVINDATLGIVNFPVGDLDAGQSVVLTQVEIPALEQFGRCQDPGDVTNIATVSGQSADTGATVDDSDPAVVRCEREDIQIVKLVSVDGGVTFFDANSSDTAPTATVGSGALYKLVVTNTGTSDLTGVVVNDATLGIVDFAVGDLAAGQSVTLTDGEIPALSKPARCADPGDVTNIASVSGVSVDTGTTVSDTDPAVVKCVREAITLLKEVSVDGGASFHDANDPSSAPAATLGSGAIYRLTVTNTGTTVLENVVVNDTTLGIEDFVVGTLGVGEVRVLDQGQIPELAPADVCATPGNVTNIASVNGTSPRTGNTVSDSDPAVVKCVRERIDIVKEVSVDGGVTFLDANDPAGAPATSVGSGALYRLTVTNTGTSDLVNVVVNDAQLGIVDFAVGDLAAGQSVVLTQGEIPALEQPARCQAPGDLTNIASVDGESVDTGNTVSDSDPAVVRCEQVAVCAIEVDKTCAVLPPPSSGDLLCQAAISATTLRYTGPDLSNATVVFEGDKRGLATYTGVDLVSGVTVLTSAQENGFTIDAGDGEGLGSKTRITINGVLEIIHTSCSAIYAADQPAPLDGGTPNPPDSSKGDPSPNWEVVNFRDKDGALVVEPDPTPPDGEQSCIIQPREASCETLGKPTTLVFRYTGDDCPGSNSQGNSSECTGTVDGTAGVTVTVDTGDGYAASPQTVPPGGLFEVTRGGSDFKSNTVIDIANAGGTQSNTVHTSCSQPLKVGDTFGALELVSFNGDSGGGEVVYRYLVSNVGNTDVTLTSVFDDLLGEQLVPAPQALPQGGFVELFSGTEVISAETTNVVDVAGNVAGDPSATCAATDSVTVEIAPPPPPPVTCSDIKDLTSLRLVWDGPDGVNLESEVGQVITGINRGDIIVLQTPKADTGNDVDVFLTGAVDGQSQFHISCSDAQMNGNEDCGAAQGNGKGDDTSLVNQWLLDGMTGQNGSFTCNIPQATGAVLEGSFPGNSAGSSAGGATGTSDVTGAATLDLGDDRKAKWSLTNNGDSDVFVTRVTVTWPAAHGQVKKFTLSGDVAKDVFDATSPTTVPDDKAFESDPNKRKIKKGETKKLEIHFTDAFKGHAEADFTYTVEFDSGQVLSFP